MSTSRTAALQTVYHVDLAPDGVLMRFCNKMHFGEMTELIVLQTFGQSLRNMDTNSACVPACACLCVCALLYCWRGLHVDVHWVRTQFTYMPDINSDWLCMEAFNPISDDQTTESSTFLLELQLVFRSQHQWAGLTSDKRLGCPWLHILCAVKLFLTDSHLCRHQITEML